MKSILTIIACVICLVLQSQDEEKISIAVYDFSHNPQLVDGSYLPSIKQYVTSAFQKSGKFTIMNRSNNSQIQSEIDLQKSRDYFSNAMVESGKKLGAKYIVTGNVDRIDLEKSGSSDSYTYRAGFSFLLKVIDIEKNELLATEQMSTSTGGGALSMFSSKTSSPSAAIDASLEKINDKIQKFIYEYFGGVEMRVVDVVEHKKGKAQKILISGGSGSGIKKGTSLTVYMPTETEVNGKKLVRSKFIGEIKVDLIEDESFSVCKVKEGDEEIMRLFNTGAELLVKIKD